MKKHLLSIIFISIFSIVFGQYKDGQAYFKLKPNSSIGNLERTDAVKFSALKSSPLQLMNLMATLPLGEIQIRLNQLYFLSELLKALPLILVTKLRK